MDNYLEPKPPALNWQATVGADTALIRARACALLQTPVVGDLKEAIIRDFFDMNFRTGMINKREKDISIANYLGQQPRQQLNFAKALEYLSCVLYEKQDYLTAADNLEILHKALDDIGMQGESLDRSMKNGRQLFSEKQHLGTIGDVLSTGEEIFNATKGYYAAKPDLIVDLQPFCDKLKAIAQEVDKVRNSNSIKR